MPAPRKPITIIVRRGHRIGAERPTKMLGIKVFEEEHAQFMALAERRGSSLSEIVREFLAAECERDERTRAAKKRR